MRLNVYVHWAVKAALTLSLVYSVLFAASNLGAVYVRLLGGNMATRPISSVLFSSGVDYFVWLGLLIFSLSWLAYNFHIRGVQASFMWLFLAVSFGLTFFSVYAELSMFLLTLVSFSLLLLYIGFVNCYLDVSVFYVFKHLFACFFVFLFFLELASLTSFLLLDTPLMHSFNSSSFVGVAHWMVLDLSFVNLAYPLLPWGYLFLVGLGFLSVFFKVGVFQSVFDYFRGRKEFVPFSKGTVFNGKLGSFSFLNSNLILGLAVAVCVVVCVVLVVLTVVPWVNPTYRLVSVDAPLYYQWVQEMRSFDFNGAVSWAFAGDRAVFMLLFYFLSMMVLPVDLVQFFPIVLLLFFSALSLLLVKEFAGTRDAAFYAVLLAPVSIQALGLIYSGYFANMLAILFIYLFYLIFLKFLRNGSRIGLFALMVVSVLILFTHPWMWFIFASSLVVFLFIQGVAAFKSPSLRSAFRLKFASIGGVLLVSVLCDFVRQLLVKTASVAYVYDTISVDLSVPSLGLLWSAMNVTVHSYLGGAFNFSILVFLSIVGFLLVLSRKSDFSDLLVSWVFIACLSVLLTNSEFAYHKFLFSMPLVVFSSLGIAWLIRLLMPNGLKGRWQKVVFLLIFGAIFLVLLNIALRFVTNITII